MPRRMPRSRNFLPRLRMTGYVTLRHLKQTAYIGFAVISNAHTVLRDMPAAFERIHVFWDKAFDSETSGSRVLRQGSNVFCDIR